MWRNFCGWLLRTLGWTAVDPVAPEDKCIILGVPHTSIWDFVISYLYYVSVGGQPYCMVKGELFWGPLGWLLRKLGGIPEDRQRGRNLALSVIKEIKAKKLSSEETQAELEKLRNKEIARLERAYRRGDL